MKNEFLQSLSDELERLEYDDIDAIITYFSEMIDDEIEEGNDEASIIARLGNPKQIAKEVILDNSQSKKTSEHDENNQFVFAENDTTKIDIDLNHFNLMLSPSDNDQLIINTLEDARAYVLVEKKGNKLHIEEKTKFSGIKHFFTKTNDSFAIEVKIPEGLPLNNLNLESVSGNITISDLNLEGVKTDIETVSGEVKLENLTTRKSNLETVSGCIEINDVTTEKLDIETISGEVALVEITSPAISIDTVSGNVDAEINGAEEEYRISIESLTKEVVYRKNQAKYLDMESISGKLNYRFKY